MPTWKNAVPSRDTQHELKREALLREAAAAFNRRGFHATSLDDIARNLGVTKPALYYYFENKHSLLHACFERAMEAAFSSLARAKREGGSGREKLRLTIQFYIEEMIDRLSCCVVLMEENALLPKDHAEQIRQRDKFERALRDLVREGVADGSIVPCDPKLVVFAMLGALNWIPKWFRHDGDWSSAQIAAAMAELMERSLSSGPAASLNAVLGPAEDAEAAPRKAARR
jgi:TetR/AcrR family transcriptional regulator